MSWLRSVIVVVVTGAACSSPDGVKVPLPNGKQGIGFDDLRYSPSLKRVLVPAGRSGNLVLVDPDTLATTAIPGFSASDHYNGDHDFGPTSVDEAHGLLFVTDRTSQELSVVDPDDGSIVSSVRLHASPDYVRYVEKTEELWVTEPSADQIEILSLPTSGAPVFAATIAVDNGPESLVIDQNGGRAYTHRWQSSTLVIDVTSRKVVAEWHNGCAASRGLAVDAARGFFFVDCTEGTVSVLDTRSGRVLSTMARGAGFDVMGYNPTLRHLYLAGTACACVVILGVSEDGKLSFHNRFEGTASAHCASADDRGHIWVCDPDGGQLLRITDPGSRK